VQQRPGPKRLVRAQISDSYDWVKTSSPTLFRRANSNVEHGAPTPVAGRLGGAPGHLARLIKPNRAAFEIQGKKKDGILCFFTGLFRPGAYSSRPKALKHA
jgi:hypothetical protein